MLRWILGGLLALVLIGAALFFWIIPARVDAQVNRVLDHGPYEISAAARALHDEIPVADLHADTLLWMRDPVKRQSRGQTDLPRLIEGGVRLQVFTAVTKSPSGLNYETNDAGSDDITLLAVAQRWPPATWGSLFERAMFQARRLAAADERYGDGFRMIKTRGDLMRALERDALAGVYGIEGAHPLEGEIENLDRLYDAGLRLIGLQHFFDNELGGSLHGLSGAGLTDFGRAVIRRANEKEMIIDVAHSSETTVRDVLALSTRPVILSHTGLKGHCNSPRNISDETMKAIADAGGLIGVGFWDGAVCAANVESIAEAIFYAVDLLGADHVALGSDFDGSVQTPLDASQLPALTQALMDAGLDDETIRAVMGENAVRFFLENLPAE
jgi:microsomal dipeptidase-like Zn-dependent dipeptidase